MSTQQAESNIHDEPSETVLEDDQVLRDVNNSDIYIRRVIKSHESKTAHKKTNDRVYNSVLTGAVLLAADGIQKEEDETDILPTVYDNIEEDEVGGYTLLIYKLLQQNRDIEQLENRN